jgi:hypothetical protein
VISPGGVLGVIPAVQRIKMGAGQAGQLAHVWADEFTVHVLIGGQLVKTVPSSLDVEDLAVLKMRGASPAGPPPAAPAPALALAGALPGGTVIEVDRASTAAGSPTWPASGSRSAPSWHAAGSRCGSTATSCTSSAAASWPRPCPAQSRPPTGPSCAGARIAAAALPAPVPGPVSVHRKVPKDGVIMVTRQRLRVGASYAGKIVTVHVEDTHFRVTCDGAEISLHPRAEQHPVTRWKAKIHAPKTETASSIS